MDGTRGTFTRFDQTLSNTDDPQLWGEHTVFYAAELINSFATEDWKELAASWRQRPEPWQLRLAGVLSESPHDAAVPLLLSVLEHTPSDRVAVVAADSLRVLTPEGPLELTPGAAQRLTRLQRSATGLAKNSLSDLIAKVRVR